MRILITGAEGQVASELLHSIEKNKFFIAPYSKNKLDITQLSLVRQTFQMIQPNMVINAAAYTQVDRAEEDAINAYAVNRDGAKHLAIVCEELKIPLIHLSTDYVFDGCKQSPYIETDSISPLNIYGQSKWEGEKMIRQYCSKHLILRVSAVFGKQGVNFVKTIMRLAQQQDVLRIVGDQITCPTPALAIADVIWRLCETIVDNPTWGTYHFCGDLPVTWYDFAKEIMKLTTHQDIRIESIASTAYPSRAKRPAYSVLNCQLLENTFGIAQADWRKGLRDVVKQLT